MVSYRDVFPAESEPVKWMSWFVVDPHKALLALLSKAYYMGRLNGAEPCMLLMDWLEATDNAGQTIDEFTPEQVDGILERLLDQLTPASPQLMMGDGRPSSVFWVQVARLAASAKGRILLPKTFAKMRDKAPMLQTSFSQHGYLMSLIRLIVSH